jgi:hypothetical protein
MAAIIVTNVGFFHHGFTRNTCSHFYLAAPVLKGTVPLLLPICALRLNGLPSDPNDGVAGNPRHSVGFDCPVTSRPAPDDEF